MTEISSSYIEGSTLIRKDGETPLFDGQGSERIVTNSSQSVMGTVIVEVHISEQQSYSVIFSCSFILQRTFCIASKKSSHNGS